MKIKAANQFTMVDVDKESIAAYCEKHKKNGRFDEAKQLEEILDVLNHSKSITDALIETTINAAFDANVHKMRVIRKEIRQLDKDNEKRRDLRNQIKSLKKANMALVPFSKRQRMRIAALSAIKH